MTWRNFWRKIHNMKIYYFKSVQYLNIHLNLKWTSVETFSFNLQRFVSILKDDAAVIDCLWFQNNFWNEFLVWVPMFTTTFCINGTVRQGKPSWYLRCDMGQGPLKKWTEHPQNLIFWKILTLQGWGWDSNYKNHNSNSPT